MYSVFGASKTKAEARATKDTSTYDDDGVALPLDEFTNNLHANTEAIFKKMRPGKISPTYSNRAEAERYLECALGVGATERATIKRVTSIETNPKTGRSKIIWEDG